jgi:hypothetical protein
LFAGNLIAAESGPKADVAAAAKKLAGQSYSWKTTMEMGGGAGGNAPRFGPTEGKADKDGTVCVMTTMGENTSEGFAKGEKGAVKTQDGWKSIAELTASQGGGGQPGQGQNRGMFLARTLRNYKAPAAEVENLAAKAKELKKTDDAIAGDLTEEAVKELLTRGRGRTGQAPEVKEAQGNVKIWVKDGAVVKYQYQVKGKMAGRDGNEREIDRTTTVEIKDVGTTKLTVPDEVKKLL